MPVIGRLDGQVDEVLIAPLERRRRHDGDEPPPDDGRGPGRAAEDRGGLEKRVARDKLKHDAVRDELPVWLL